MASSLLGAMSLFPMVRRIVASVLLILVASPFTAPFETCDVATLFGSPTTLAPVQVQFAWAVDEDAPAIAPGAAATRRARSSLKVLSHVAPDAPDSRLFNDDDTRSARDIGVRGHQPSPASRSPLRL